MRKNSYKNSVRQDDFKRVNTINGKKVDKYNVGDMDIMNASSTMDCTGLMYRPPTNATEVDSYHEIYSFGPPGVNISDVNDK